mmetsp:Transcript_12877/g.31316  ORF Transcript_12877/g.31316 Transcript_12877/m.31316 type:complete len:250 (-) Transcript_12877:85-834(-)
MRTTTAPFSSSSWQTVHPSSPTASTTVSERCSIANFEAGGFPRDRFASIARTKSMMKVSAERCESARWKICSNGLAPAPGAAPDAAAAAAAAAAIPPRPADPVGSPAALVGGGWTAPPRACEPRVGGWVEAPDAAAPRVEEAAAGTPWFRWWGQRLDWLSWWRGNSGVAGGGSRNIIDCPIAGNVVDSPLPLKAWAASSWLTPSRTKKMLLTPPKGSSAGSRAGMREGGKPRPTPGGGIFLLSELVCSE